MDKKHFVELCKYKTGWEYPADRIGEIVFTKTGVCIFEYHPISEPYVCIDTFEMEPTKESFARGKELISTMKHFVDKHKLTAFLFDNKEEMDRYIKAIKRPGYAEIEEETEDKIILRRNNG